MGPDVKCSLNVSILSCVHCVHSGQAFPAVCQLRTRRGGGGGQEDKEGGGEGVQEDKEGGVGDKRTGGTGGQEGGGGRKNPRMDETAWKRKK